jgi:septum formation protein
MIAPIILASQSPRRKQLLEWAEVPFSIVIQSTDESFPATMPPEEVPVYIATNKAIAVQAMVGNQVPVLAADTVVVLGNTIINKPANREDAIRILSSLSGQKHRVITGVVIMSATKTISFADITEVEFHSLTREQIIFYVDKYAPYDKAGAYAIQEWIGVVGIKSINGDFYNVMGLPVSRVVQALQEL